MPRRRMNINQYQTQNNKQDIVKNGIFEMGNMPFSPAYRTIFSSFTTERLPHIFEDPLNL